MSFFLDCCNGNDLGPELTYRAPIDALTPLELEIITASYIGSRVVDLNKVGSKFGDRTLMDLGLRFPSAIAFILPAGAADAQAATTAPKSRSPGDGAPKLQDSGGKVVSVVTFSSPDDDDEPPEGELSSSAIASFSAAHPRTLIYLPLLFGADATALMDAIDGYNTDGVLRLEAATSAPHLWREALKEVPRCFPGMRALYLPKPRPEQCGKPELTALKASLSEAVAELAFVHATAVLTAEQLAEIDRHFAEYGSQLDLRAFAEVDDDCLVELASSRGFVSSIFLHPDCKVSAEVRAEWKCSEPLFDDDESAKFFKLFKTFDADSSGAIDARELTQLFEDCGQGAVVPQQVQQLIADYAPPGQSSREIPFDAFLKMLKYLKDTGYYSRMWSSSFFS